MSIIKDTVHDLDLNKLPKRLAEYELLIEAAQPCFDLTHKKLEEACKVHANDLMVYDMMLQECKTIEETIKFKVEEVESLIFKRLNETNKKVLGTTEIKQYIKSDPQYVAAMEILLEVNLTRRRLESIVEALKSLGWSLGHIVKLRIAQLEDTILW